MRIKHTRWLQARPADQPDYGSDMDDTTFASAWLALQSPAAVRPGHVHTFTDLDGVQRAHCRPADCETCSAGQQVNRGAW